MRHIILTGFMGAGKTTVGKCLARKLGYAFYDTDELIEVRTGMTVKKIFQVMGEEKFRSLETEILKGSWTEGENWVLSVGGGLPMREENRRLLKKIGFVIYLRVQADTVLRRLEGDTMRPLLQGDHVKERVDALLSYREPLYEDGADFVVDVDGKPPEAIREVVIQAAFESAPFRRDHGQIQADGKV